MTLEPGDILVADVEAFGGTGGIIHVDPATGKQTAVSNNAMAINAGTSEFFDDPYAVTIAPGGQILVADSQAFTNNDGGVISVDPVTGKQTKVSANDLAVNAGSSEFFSDPYDIELDESGQILVLDGSSSSVIGVNPGTGKETLVSANSLPANAGTSEFFMAPAGIALDDAGGILVTDQNAFDATNFTGGVIGVNPIGGKETKVSANDLAVNVGSSEFFRDPWGIEVDDAGQLLVADQSAFPSFDGGVIGVNPTTGKETLVSSNEQVVNDGISDYFNGPSGITVTEAGGILVADEGAFTGFQGGVIGVNPTTGKQTIVSNNEQAVNTGTTDFFRGPYGIEEVPTPTATPTVPDTPKADPPVCQGKPATIVGTSGEDSLQGTAGPDVIATLGGGDEVAGGNGKDTICGGDGNDLLRGGNGKDALAGENGHDQLLGGKGKDRCSGGPGTDSSRGC